MLNLYAKAVKESSNLRILEETGKGLAGEEDMLKHFSHRQELELAICREVFPDKYSILKSKGYKETDIQ